MQPHGSDSNMDAQKMAVHTRLRNDMKPFFRASASSSFLLVYYLVGESLEQSANSVFDRRNDHAPPLTPDGCRFNSRSSAATASSIFVSFLNISRHLKTARSAKRIPITPHPRLPQYRLRFLTMIATDARTIPICKQATPYEKFWCFSKQRVLS